MSRVPRAGVCPVAVSMRGARRSASSTPRRWMPTTTSDWPAASSTISEAIRASTRRIASASRSEVVGIGERI